MSNKFKLKSREMIDTGKSDEMYRNTSPESRANISCDDEHLSPFMLQFTQDGGEDDLDVVWDWDSPRTKKNRCVIRKRLLHSSPKLKRIHHEKHLPQFNSLKAELEELANKLNDENSNYTENNSVLSDSEVFFSKPKSIDTNDLNDMFNDDSLDEEMIKCSQKVEEAYNLNKWCTSIINNNKECKRLEIKQMMESTIEDDSFDVLFEEIKVEDIEKQSQEKSKPIITKSVSSPRSISRTNSVPSDFFNNKSVQNPSCSSLNTRTKSEEYNPIQFSPEEIEKKRQEARAKLEHKRKHHEIEKKRLEALERLRKSQKQKK